MKAKSIVKEPAIKFTKRSLREYGSYVVEDRAVPDFRDGLKPSHRAVLWAMNQLGLRSSSKHSKAALTVGAAIGRFHPHGDTSSYGAMVTIANTQVKLVDGQGNWGSPVDPPAAYRYTEARLSKFADAFMLNKDYLKVVPHIDNFSREEKFPLYLPSLLPFILMNGGAPIPAYGVAAGNPAFTLESIAKVVCAGLAGQELDSSLLSKHLKVTHEWGCEPVYTRKELREIMETGRGSIRYTAIVSGDRKAKRIYISSFLPGALSSLESCEKTLNTIAGFPGVKRAYSQQGKRSEHSGPYGACFVIETKSLDESKWDALVAKVKAKVSTKISVRLGVTIRHEDKPNKFKYLNFVELFSMWLRYRVNLEKRLLKYQLGVVNDQLYVYNTYLWAVDNIDALLDKLKVVLKDKSPVNRLMREFKLEERAAEIILHRQVIQLAKLGRADIVTKIREYKALRREYTEGLRNPGPYAAAKTRKLVDAYLANP